MQLHHLVVTLTGAAQPLTTTKSIVGSYVALQGFAANSNVIYVGGVSDAASTQVVSSSDYGVRLPAPDSSGNPAAPLPIDPWNKGLTIALNDIWVIGTNTEKLAVTYWTP